MTGDKDGGGVDRGRRRDLARQAVSTEGWPGIDDDPYWLCNMHGRINTSDLLQQATDLEEDAQLLRDAFEKIEDGEWLPEEAAVYIARNANYGDYNVADWLDDIPITEEP